MPKRIAVHTVVVQREGKRKEIMPGTLFDFTVEEVKELEALKAVRKPVVEDAEQAAALQVSTENSSTTVDLSEMTVDQLKAHAAELGIDLGESTKKADILATIQAAGKGEGEDL